MSKKLSAVAIGLVSLLSLTACNPPLPPEVKTALLEQNIICESGEATMAIEPSLVTLIDNLQFSLKTECPEASVVLSEDPAAADLVVTAVVPELTAGQLAVPFAVESAAVVVNTYDLGAVAISAPTLAGILSGQITNWSDPALVAENPSEIMPDLPITVITEAHPAVISAVEKWISASTGQDYKTNFTPNEAFDHYTLLEADNGAVALLTTVQNIELGLLQAKLWLGETEAEIAAAEANSLNAAASQFSFETVDNQLVTANLDFEAEVAKAAGRNTAVAPYQLVFPLYVVTTSTTPSNIVKFVASFGLRASAQSELELVGLSALPEALRIQAKTIISQGLPEPEFTQEQLDQLGLTE